MKPGLNDGEWSFQEGRTIYGGRRRGKYNFVKFNRFYNTVSWSLSQLVMVIGSAVDLKFVEGQRLIQK